MRLWMYQCTVDGVWMYVIEIHTWVNDDTFDYVMRMAE